MIYIEMNSKTKIFIYLLGLVSMTLAIMELSFGLFPIGILGAIVIFILSLILLIIVGLIDWRKKTTFYKPFLIFSILMLISLLSFLGIAKFQNEISDKRANEIILALNDFYELKGKYPSRLKDLTNEQLKSIPSTGLGLGFREFDYKPDTGSNYWLKYDSYFGVTNWYNSETNSWHSDD